MTTRRDFRRVRAAVVDTSAQLRSEMRAALYDKGIPEPIVCKGMDPFLEVAGQEMLDLVVCDAGAFGTDFSAAMQRIRQNAMGGNPFVVVIATLQEASLGTVQGALNGGVDDILRRPAPSKKVIDRIDLLMKDRKPFVTTRGYVGPTRRSFVRQDDTSEFIEVPNTLRAKVVDKIPDAKLQRAIERAVVEVSKKVTEHPLAGIDRLIQRTLAWHGGNEDELSRDLAHLIALSMEMSEHYRGTELNHIADLAVALSNLVKRIAEQGPAALRAIDLQLLRSLGAVIRNAIAAEDESGDAVHEIATMVQRYSGGRRLREEAPAPAPANDGTAAAAAAAPAPANDAKSAPKKQGELIRETLTA
jgi:DNA-binding response OmpR family regulator